MSEPPSFASSERIDQRKGAPDALYAGRVGRDPAEVRRINEERQRNLPPEVRAADPSNPDATRRRIAERDDRDRARRDFR